MGVNKVMSVQRYPFLVSIYKGEGRLLVVPVINHIGGYSVDSSWFVNLTDAEEYSILGERALEAVEFVKNSPLSSATPKEREVDAAWKKNTKYKSWLSFWKNNNMAYLKYYQDGRYEVYSAKKLENPKGGYYDCIKEVNLPPTATAEEIGRAVIEVFEAAEEYYNEKPAYDPYPTKSLQLLDEASLTVKYPADRHFVDEEDGGAAEIYQCYSYQQQEGGESSAEFFLGIAPELDCNMESGNVRSAWEELHGKAETFEMQECGHEVFTHRAEMRNKSVHKISYLVQSEEDLLLECSMEVHQPGRRKKLDEKLTGLFEKFVMNCKR